jgi:hypothetical protein
MRIRFVAIAATLCLSVLPLSAATLPLRAQQTETLVLTTAELMRATALDEIFTQFGPVIEAAPRDQPVPFTSAMLGVWSEAVREVFDPGAMHASLARTLEGKFSEDDNAAFAGFFRSPFGEKVSEIERAVTLLGPQSQLAARATGIELADASEPRRKAQVEEMLDLVSAEISTAMVQQSVRGMLIGMAMTGQQGDIEVPWEEIDAQIAAIMPSIEADVAVTQRAMMYYAYRDLSESELDDYLGFLRTEAAQRFYAIAAYAVGEIIAERMRAFGETLVVMLNRVNV